MLIYAINKPFLRPEITTDAPINAISAKTITNNTTSIASTVTATLIPLIISGE